MSVFAESSGAAVAIAQTDSFARSLARRKIAVVTLAFLGLVTAACILAPLLAPYDPQAQDLTRVLTGPTSHNLVGTDELGRDVLSRLLYGGTRSLLSVLEGVTVVVALGVPLGLTAGYVGGWTDRVLSRLAEVLMAIPVFVFVLVVIAVLPANEDAAMVTFGILGVPVMFRVVRAAALRAREELYIAAARIAGVRHLRIVMRHVLPRALGPIIVQASLFAAYGLLFETSLGFLGLTGDTSHPTWGGMVGEGSASLLQQSWLVFPPGIVIALTILSFLLLGDAVRDAVTGPETVTGSRKPRASALSASPISTPVSISWTEDAPPRPSALLDVNGLAVVVQSAADDATVLDDVSFSIRAGETLALIGESGCGKTVSARAILRLLPSTLRVSAGEVRWDGRELLGLSDRQFDRLRGSQIGYITQEPQSSLDPTFTIGSQLREVVRHHERCSSQRAKLRAFQLLEQVELPDPGRLLRSHAHELSGGMAQRVAIALALAGRPRLLIADEPTTALDVTVQAQIMSLLERLKHETDMAILLITHNWGLVADICDRAIVMYAGQIVEQAPVQKMYDRPLHPYTAGLLRSHPSFAEPQAELAAMAGNVPAPGAWPAACRFAPRCRYASKECLVAPIPLLAPEPDRFTRCVRVEEAIAGRMLDV